MKMKSFILKYASKIMFYDVNIACYHPLMHVFLSSQAHLESKKRREMKQERKKRREVYIKETREGEENMCERREGEKHAKEKHTRNKREGDREREREAVRSTWR